MPPHRLLRNWPLVLLAALSATLVTAMAAAPRSSAGSTQVPDSGAQRAQMIEELRTANRQLAEIVALLREMKPGDGKDAAAEIRPARPAGKGP